MTAPSKSGFSKDMDEFLSLLISARSMSCPFFKLQGVGTDATHTISSKLHRTRILQHQKRMYKSQFRCVHHSSAASSNQKPFSHAIDGHAICEIIAPFFSQMHWSRWRGRSMMRSSQTTAPLSFIKHALRRRDHHCMHLKYQNLVVLIPEHRSIHTRTLEMPILQNSPFTIFRLISSLRGNGTDFKKRPFLPILMLHLSRWYSVSTASASLLAAHCILAPKRLKRTMTALILYAHLVNRSESRIYDMLKSP